jgi:hypothetical protein
VTVCTGSASWLRDGEYQGVAFDRRRNEYGHRVLSVGHRPRRAGDRDQPKLGLLSVTATVSGNSNNESSVVATVPVLTVSLA